MQQRQFLVIIEQDEDGAYIARVPSLPGCHTYGQTLDELNKNLEEVIELWMKERLETTPVARFHSVFLLEYSPRAHA